MTGGTSIVHRKGATPAGKGVLGVIPGSMASPAFVVRGRGEEDSLLSASHGAGPRDEPQGRQGAVHVEGGAPAARGGQGELLSAGIDENPLVYRDIHAVMAAQDDLVDVVARFTPRIVRMADAGERPED